MYFVEQKVFKANYKVKAGDVFTVMLPEPELLEIRSEAIPLDVIFEDEDVVVVNKAVDGGASSTRPLYRYSC